MILTPKKIVEELDKYIISQDEAKKNVAISLRNRERRKMIEDKILQKEITPKNIILIGDTGVGKTEIARRIALVANAPFIKVEATKYTEVGYVGKDVESIIKDLVSLTFTKMKEEKMNSLRDEYYDLILEKIARILKPYDTISDIDKAKIIEDIKKGIYDDSEIEIDKNKKDGDIPVIEVVAGGDDTNINSFLDQMLTNLPSRNKKLKTNVKNAINILLDEEIEKNLDFDLLKYKVIENVENNGIIFIDEIDKIADKGSNNRGDVSRQGVQRDLLPIVEGCTVMTKLGPVKTEHILFIAAGAFSQSSPSDLMPELQGRFPIKVRLKSLEKKDYVKILTNVQYNLITQYTAMLEKDNVLLEFTKNAIDKIADIAVTLNNRTENLGARRLPAIIEEILKDTMFNAPFSKKKKVTIDKKFIENIIKLDSKEENLDDYIL